MADSIFNSFGQISIFFSDMLSGFKSLIFSGSRSYYATFFIITVPILFAALEVLFDFIIPTFLDLRPMGIRRFFIPRAEALKCPELKAYKPLRAEGFNILKYRKHRSEKFNTTFTPAEEKHYQLLYQQKYNTTASPLELRRFVYSEVKRYGYVPSYTVFNYRGMKSSVNGAVDLGIKSYKFIKLHKQSNDPDSADVLNQDLDNTLGVGEGRDYFNSKRLYQPNETTDDDRFD